MTIGYRFNIEAVLFRLADEEFEKAKQRADEAYHSARKTWEDNDEVSSVVESYRDIPSGEESLASACLAGIGWASGFEAFVNLIWLQHVAESMPLQKMSDRLIRTIKTIEKTKWLLELKDEESSPSWLGGVCELIDMRNRLLHYKGAIEPLGTFQPPTLATDLSFEQLEKMRDSVVTGIRTLSGLYPIGDYSIDYIDKQYELGTYSG